MENYFTDPFSKFHSEEEKQGLRKIAEVATDKEQTKCKTKNANQKPKRADI